VEYHRYNAPKFSIGGVDAPRVLFCVISRPRLFCTWAVRALVQVTANVRNSTLVHVLVYETYLFSTWGRIMHIESLRTTQTQLCKNYSCNIHEQTSIGISSVSSYEPGRDRMKLYTTLSHKTKSPTKPNDI
jgi:hypothetical protein